MRSRVLLVEYDRAITTQKWAEKILAAIYSRDEEHAEHDRWQLYGSTLAAFEHHQVGSLDAMEPAAKAHALKVVDHLLGRLEQIDPTPNKMYMAWLVRQYVSGALPLYDMATGDAQWQREDNRLAQYHTLKLKRQLKPEDADINRIHDWDALEGVVHEHITTSVMPSQGASTLIYQDATVRVIRPDNVEASCALGSQTKWCTSASVSNNKYALYTRHGQLFVLIPATKAYKRERYQVFAPKTDDGPVEFQVMDDRNQPFPLATLMQRFPKAIAAMVDAAPELDFYLPLTTAQVGPIFRDALTSELDYAWRYDDARVQAAVAASTTPAHLDAVTALINHGGISYSEMPTFPIDPGLLRTVLAQTVEDVAQKYTRVFLGSYA